MLLVGVLIAALGIGGGLLLSNKDDGNSATNGSSGASKALADGLQAELQGNTATATKKFREVVALDPANKLAYYNLGLIEQTAKNVTAAEADYRKTIAIDPKYAPALYNLGIIRADAGNKIDAIDLYRRATVADPTFARAFLNLGLLLFDTGDTTGSAAALSKAVQLDASLKSHIPTPQQPAT